MNSSAFIEIKGEKIKKIIVLYIFVQRKLRIFVIGVM
jgi:hypothetical protein